MLLVSNIKLKKNDKGCNSVHPITIELKTPEHLKRYIGRTYRLPTETKYHVLNGNEKHLIGQKILVKSPITCAAKHDHICKDCYGEELFYTNYGVNVGSLAGAFITNP